MESSILQTMILSFIISIILSPFIISYMKKLKLGQYIRDDGPKRHLKKAGTPTMGGIIFIISLILTLIITGKIFDPLAAMALFLTVGNGIIGLLDDSAKIVLHRSLGLKARSKLLGQGLIVAVFYLLLIFYGVDSIVRIPFTGNAIDFSYFYPLLILVMVLGATNAVNLTDGIDGLAAGTAIVALLTFLFISIQQDLIGLSYFSGALVGATFAFLIFNLHPARVFMGDVGSLSLGAALAALAILTKTEFYLVIIGGVFVLETLSVIIQVISFRLTGKRVFLMSPLHHHYELKGWSEWQVVIGFWTLSFFFALIILVKLGFSST